MTHSWHWDSDRANKTTQNMGNIQICRGVIQAVFEIDNRFWAHNNWLPNNQLKNENDSKA